MTTALTETDTYSADVQAPVNGEPRTIAGLRAAMTDINNRVGYLNNRRPNPGSPTTLTDANTTLPLNVAAFRIPSPAASRVHTFTAGTPTGGDGTKCLITRPIVGTSASITIRRSSTTTIAVLDAGAQNWVEVTWVAAVGDWVASAWSADVSSIVAA